MLPQTKTKLPNPRTRARLLAELYNAQEHYGWLSEEAIRHVAESLNLSPGQVYSTASFYTMFKLEPEGKYRIQICEGLSCYLVGGAEPIVDYLKKRLDIRNGSTSADGRFTLEIVQCLAACDLAPAIRINDELFGGITDEKIDALIADYSARD